MLVPVTVADLMDDSVETTDPDAPVRTAAATLSAADRDALVVWEDDGPVGIITDADVTALVGRGDDPVGTPVEAVMSSPVATTTPDASIETAATVLGDADVDQLPVVEDGSLVGVLASADLADYLPRLLRRARDRPGGDRPAVADLRPDTAYEHEDWTFEYRGDETRIDVGDALTFEKTLSAADVRAFADASGDTNRLHLDEDYAAGTRFGERIVHGTLVGGTISAALARLPGLTIYLSQDIGYLGPVPVGDRVAATCEVVERVGPDRFRLATTVAREDGEVVVDGEATVLSDPLPGSE